MNHSYGHLDENNSIVYAHNSITVDGKVYLQPTADIYLRADPPEKLL